MLAKDVANIVAKLLEPWLVLLIGAELGALADAVVKAVAVETEVSIDVVKLLVVIEDVAMLESVCEEIEEKLDQELEEGFIRVVVDTKAVEVEVEAAETVELPIEVCTLIEDVVELEN